MKLSDLSPASWQRFGKFTPQFGGEDPLPELELAFNCPKCGPPARVRIIVTTNAISPGKWHVEYFPSAAVPLDEWAKTITVKPSIHCHATMHGPKRPPCNAHFSISQGEIVWA